MQYRQSVFPLNFQASQEGSNALFRPFEYDLFSKIAVYG